MCEKCEAEEMTDLDRIEAVAQEVDGRIIADYSGRFMYGQTCVGIVCDNSSECLEIAGEYGLKGANVDNMGLRMIVYWPRIQRLAAA